VASVVLRTYARRQLFQHGKAIRIWPYVLGLLIGLPLVAALIFGMPFKVELPELKGFNFSGGVRVIPELVALLLALSIYTAAFIAEIVRAGNCSRRARPSSAGQSYSAF
jgi:general L-amino acid transport system permease protein